MEKIIVNVGWSGKNFNASLSDNVPGAVVITDKTFEGLITAVASTLDFHVEGMVDDGDEVPTWLINKEYEFEYKLNAAAIIRKSEQYTSLAAIARASGINERQLSHYANGLKTPRPQQRERIINGIHKIAKELCVV